MNSQRRNKKVEKVDAIMLRLNQTYQPKSEISKIVKNALEKKLSFEELSALWAIITTV